MAEDAGLFRRYGLNVHLSYIASSSSLVPAMVAGDIPIAVTGGGEVVAADVKGSDIVFVASLVDSWVGRLYGTYGIHAVSQLRGKKVAITKYGSIIDLAAELALPRFGLYPGKNVELVQAGGVPQIMATLKNGAVQGGLLSPPIAFAADKLGLPTLESIKAMRIPMLGAGVAASGPYMQAHPETVLRYLKAITAAIALIRQDPAQAKAILGKYTKIHSASILQHTYQTFLPFFQRTPRVSPAAIETFIRQSGVAGKRQPSQFYDNGPIDQLAQSGFINRLYGAGGAAAK